VCGAILPDAPFPTIGNNNVSVPNRYYKAVYDPKNKKAIGFIFKNGMSSGKLNSYAISIDEIESEADVDLFPSLDDELENIIEADSDFTDWNFELLE
jgi:endonuclease G